MKVAPLLLVGLTSLCTAQNPPAPEPAKLLRYPHIQGDKIAFVHGGDIWTASAQGGQAHRVTSFDDGLELFPRISPDGNWIAFSGEYTGTRQIYLVPYAGGTPRQLTFYPDVGRMPPRGGYDHLPLDWTPDGSKILIKANRTPYGQRVARYFLVDPWNGGLEQPLQIPEGGPASFSPDGRKLAYNIISREWRTWKRYKAGRAQDVYLYDLDADEIQKITDWEGTDNFPMWLGDRVYYTSDRNGTLNLYRYDVGSGETTQVTDYSGFDVLWPTRGNGGLIFEAGGTLHVMDAATEDVRELSITLADDQAVAAADLEVRQPKSFASFAPSPSGNRVLVEFRGDIFSAPKEHGEVRNMTPHAEAPRARPRRGHRTARPSRTSRRPATTTSCSRATSPDWCRTPAHRETRARGSSSYKWSPDSKKIGWSPPRPTASMLLDVLTGWRHDADRPRHREGGHLDVPSFNARRQLFVTYTKTGAQLLLARCGSRLRAQELPTRCR